VQGAEHELYSTDGQFGKGNEMLINDRVPIKKTKTKTNWET